jgi:hypothetical protein
MVSTWMGDHLQSEFKSQKSVGEIQRFTKLGNTERG